MSEALAKAARIEHAEGHPYAWVITRDRDLELNGDGDGRYESSVGVEGPSNAPDDLLALAKQGKGTRFRTFDEGDIDDCNEDHPGAVAADHELYGVVYEGVLVDPEGEWPFGPLDDYGRPNYGCIGISLFDEKKQIWEEV
jgi:hypothetical protein